METIVTSAKSSSNPLAMVSLLGMAVDVTSRLKNQKDESLTQVSLETKVILQLLPYCLFS
jgi:hypothetical protein